MYVFIELKKKKKKKNDEKCFFSPLVLVDPLFQAGQVNRLYPAREKAKTSNISHWIFLFKKTVVVSSTDGINVTILWLNVTKQWKL